MLEASWGIGTIRVRVYTRVALEQGTLLQHKRRPSTVGYTCTLSNVLRAESNL